MSKGHARNTVHSDTSYWVVSWWWEATKYQRQNRLGSCHTETFTDKDKALDYARSKRFGLLSDAETPIIKVYVSKVEPVMRWELDESITVLETDEYGVETCKHADGEVFKRRIINGSEIRFIGAEMLEAAKKVKWGDD